LFFYKKIKSTNIIFIFCFNFIFADFRQLVNKRNFIFLFLIFYIFFSQQKYFLLKKNFFFFDFNNFLKNYC
jgi:hypothetical protein